MNYTSVRAAAAGPRTVNRAVGESRRGVAVLVLGADGDRLLALPAETASPSTLEEFLAAMAQGARPALLVAPSRAAGLDRGTDRSSEGGDLATVSIPIEIGRLNAAALRGLADPTVRPADPLGLMTAQASPYLDPPMAQAALLLAKLGRLLPAMLVASAAPEAGTRAALLEVEAAEILAYPGDTSEGLVRAAEARVPLAEAGDARVVAFRPADGGIEHLAILIGQPEQATSPLVRVHSECFTGDLLGSLRCDCGPQLHQAIRRMAAEGAGVILYMAQEGRGIGLVNKLRAYALQDGQGGQPPLDTLDANRALGYGADERSFAAAATMLRRLGITRIRLLTNNPEKIAALTAHGIEVTGRISHAIAANGVNDAYLETKARRLGHLLG
jgi:GTP cyclohydrolase II